MVHVYIVISYSRWRWRRWIRWKKGSEEEKGAKGEVVREGGGEGEGGVGEGEGLSKINLIVGRCLIYFCHKHNSQVKS